MVILLLACGGPAGLDPDVPPVVDGAWARPEHTATWQIQLQGPVALDYDVDVVDVDLFDTPDETLTAIRTSGHLVCYFSAGSLEDWRDDADTVAPAAVGRDLDGWPGERWLDVRHPDALALAERRLDHAVERGCDLVDPDNVDGYANRTGFALTRDDQLAFNRRVANAAHTRGLGVLLKNGTDLVDDLVAYYDGNVVEECAAYDECDRYQPFVDLDRPVFQIEYPEDADGAEALAAEVCPPALAAGRRALVLPLALDDAFRVACDG